MSNRRRSAPGRPVSSAPGRPGPRVTGRGGASAVGREGGSGTSPVGRDESERGVRAAFRRPTSPELGMRFAYSYAVAVLATLVALPVVMGIVGSLYSRGVICPDEAVLGCAVLWFGGALAAVLGVLLAVGAWFFRLGWRWWLAGVALVLLMVEVLVDPFSPWFVLALVVPAVATALSAPELPGRRVRTGVVLALGAVAVLWLAWAVLGS